MTDFDQSQLFSYDSGRRSPWQHRCRLVCFSLHVRAFCVGSLIGTHGGDEFPFIISAFLCLLFLWISVRNGMQCRMEAQILPL